MLKKSFQSLSLFFLLFLLAFLYDQLSHEFIVGEQMMSELSLGVDNGQQASPFSAKDLTGETVSLEEFLGGNIVLFFFTSWCEVCGEQWMHFEQAHKIGLLADTTLLAVNLTKVERHVDDVKNYMKNLPIKDLTLMLDEKGAVQDLYKIVGIPTVIFIDPSGVIRNRNHGFLTIGQLEKILQTK